MEEYSQDYWDEWIELESYKNEKAIEALKENYNKKYKAKDCDWNDEIAIRTKSPVYHARVKEVFKREEDESVY